MDDYSNMPPPPDMAAGDQPPAKKSLGQRLAANFKDRGTRRILISVGVVAAVFGVGYLAQGSPDPIKSDLRAPTKVTNQAAGGAEQMSNPMYRNLIDQTNEQVAQQAEKTPGATALPIINTPAIPENYNPLELDAEPPAPVPVAVAPVQQPDPALQMQQQRLEEERRRAAERANQERLAAMMAAAQQMQARWQVSFGHQVTDVRTGEGASGAVGSGAGTVDARASGGGPAPAVVIVPGGATAHAYMVTTADSDAPGSPLMARIAGGPYDGATLVGTFANSRAGLVVRFTSMNWRNEDFGVNALAVDPSSGDLATYDYHDPRVVERFVLPIAAKVIEGIAEVYTRPTGTVVTDLFSGTAIEDRQEPDIRDAAWGGLGEAASLMSEELTAGRQAGAHYKIRSGAEVTVLFLSAVTRGQ